MVTATYYITKKNGWLVAFYLISFIGSLCAWGWPKPWGIPYLVLLPLLGLYLHFMAQTRDTKDEDSSPYTKRSTMTGSAILLSLFCLAPSPLLFHFQILDWKLSWLPFSLMTFLVLVLVRFLFPVVRRSKFALVFALCGCAIYSYGATLDLNAYLDHSEPTAYPTKVAYYDVTWVRGGRNRDGPAHPAYRVIFLPVGPIQQGRKFGVSEKFYKAYPTNSSCVVSCNLGFFRIPWLAFIGDFAQ